MRQPLLPTRIPAIAANVSQRRMASPPARRRPCRGRLPGGPPLPEWCSPRERAAPTANENDDFIGYDRRKLEERYSEGAESTSDGSLALPARGKGDEEEVSRVCASATRSPDQRV